MIYINGRFLTQIVTGVQRFGIEVIKELDNMVKDGEIEILSPPGIVNHVNLKHINIRTIGSKSNNYWTQIVFPAYVIKKNGVSLTMSGLCPIIKPDYFVAHDITFMRHPESFSKMFRLSYSICYKLVLNRCKKIFTVSNFSRSEISEAIHVNKDKFFVVSPSSSHLIRDKFQEVDLLKWKISSEYYLSVSSQNIHKNQQFILNLADLHPEKLFVIVGGSKIHSFNSVEHEERDNVIFTGYVTNDELFTIYKKAKGFIFPSVYEGFGLPPLEAITMGVIRVAVSDIPVLKEIYDKGVYYFDPMKADSFDFEAFDNTLIIDEDRDLYLKEHNWKDTAYNILKVMTLN